MRQLIEGDTRQPVAGWLTYAPGVTPDPNWPMGPNLLGEALWPVAVHDVYDPITEDVYAETEFGIERVRTLIVDRWYVATLVGFAYQGPISGTTGRRHQRSPWRNPRVKLWQSELCRYYQPACAGTPRRLTAREGQQ